MLNLMYGQGVIALFIQHIFFEEMANSNKMVLINLIGAITATRTRQTIMYYNVSLLLSFH